MTGDPITDGGDGDRPTQSRQFAYDRDEDQLPSHAVVRAVAAITNRSVLDLEPLHDAIDPNTLNEMFEGATAGTGSPELSFGFEDFEVTVTDEKIHVREMGDGD